MNGMLNFLVVVLAVVAATSAPQSWKDKLAEVACSSLSTIPGLNHAVRRPCKSGKSCRTICEKRNRALEDPFLGPLLTSGLRFVLLLFVFVIIMVNNNN